VSTQAPEISSSLSYLMVNTSCQWYSSQAMNITFDWTNIFQSSPSSSLLKYSWSIGSSDSIMDDIVMSASQETRSTSSVTLTASTLNSLMVAQSSNASILFSLPLYFYVHARTCSALVTTALLSGKFTSILSLYASFMIHGD
jgi:hypothetical protein